MGVSLCLLLLYDAVGSGERPALHGPVAHTLLSLSCNPRQASQMDHLTPLPTFLHVCLISGLKNKKGIHSNWLIQTDKMQFYITNLKNATGMVFIIVQDKKRRSKVIQMTVCLCSSGGRVGQAGEMAFCSLPISFLWSCALALALWASRLIFFCWERLLVLPLAHTLLFVLFSFNNWVTLDFSLILALRPDS